MLADEPMDGSRDSGGDDDGSDSDGGGDDGGSDSDGGGGGDNSGSDSDGGGGGDNDRSGGGDSDSEAGDSDSGDSASGGDDDGGGVPAWSHLAGSEGSGAGTAMGLAAVGEAPTDGQIGKGAKSAGTGPTATVPDRLRHALAAAVPYMPKARPTCT